MGFFLTLKYFISIWPYFFYIWLTLFYKNVRWFNKHNNFNKFGNYIMIWALKGWVSVIIQFLLGLINYYDSDYPYQICLIFVFETSNLCFCGGDAGCVAYRFSTKKTTTHDCYYYLLISDSFPTSVLKSIRNMKLPSASLPLL